MKKAMKLSRKAGIILTAGILVLLVTGCWNSLQDSAGGSATGGNVTVTVETQEAGRTIRPNTITASAFERFELEFTKGASVKTLTLSKPNTSGTINLEAGTWDITALGYLKIENREYEAAQGTSSVTVSSGSNNVAISLRTGIFNGIPGLFSYHIDYPANVNEAVLEITPLIDPHGYETANTGKTVDLNNQGKTGSFELFPGYYLLSLSANTVSTMAVWNELVHIYSGQETIANYAFAAGDFSGTIAMSGTVQGGELEGNHITEAVVTAYADENCLNRITGVKIPSFTKMTVAPYYYTGDWSITVPSTLVGKDIYFLIEITMGGPAGTKTYTIKSDWAGTVSASGNTDIDLWSTYHWWKWIENGNDNALTYTIGQDGTVTITTTETVEYSWDVWRQIMGFYFFTETNVRYVCEFEVWTDGSDRSVRVNYQTDGIEQDFDINATPKTFTIVSEVTPNTYRNVEFRVGHTDVTGTFYIKIKSIKPSSEYTLPDFEGQSRLTATAVTGGIHLKVDLRELPYGVDGLQFTNQTTGGYFETYWGSPPHDDYYEFIYPYVQAGKEYTFTLNWQGIRMIQPSATVTATGGRGELTFTNADDLLLVKDGNNLGLNKPPVVSTFNKANIENERYEYHFVSGASWEDPTATWRFTVMQYESLPTSINLVDPAIFPSYFNDLPAIFGKTCFSQITYVFDYGESDLYPTGSQSGMFRTMDIRSTPFTYPNVIPNVFTAEPDPEGVKLTIDVTKLPEQTNQLGIQLKDYNSNASLYFSSDTWQQSWGKFYGQSQIEVIYPFVNSGEAYTFVINFETDNFFASASASVTPNAGLGNLTWTNVGTNGLSYNSATKTVSFTDTPELSQPNIAQNAQIERAYWQFQFYKGHNWNDNSWVHPPMESDSLITSFVLDETFNPLTGVQLSEQTGFVSFVYHVVYDGWDFQTPSITSPSFTFPYFGPAGYIYTYVGTAFDTNSNLSIKTNDSVTKDNPLNAVIYNYNFYEGYYPTIAYAWYIDGVLQQVSTSTYFNGYDYGSGTTNLPTSDLAPGMHYGLAMVTIDGVAFAKEFSFRVVEN